MSRSFSMPTIIVHKKKIKKTKPKRQAIYSNESAVEQPFSNFFSNQVRYEHKDGKDYLVVPGVPVQEQVMNTYLLPAEEIQAELNAWNGIPLSIRHAQKNNGSVQVDNPDVPIIGNFYNTQWDNVGKRMLGDYWIDETLAMRYPEGQIIIGSIKNGQMLETSTAYWADEENVPGSFGGKSYTTVHRNLKPDHIAIFPGDKLGACSIQDGCGVNRNMQQNCEECMYQQGAKHPWHKGRPGEKGGSTSTAPGKAQEATERADRATKIAIETRTPEAYKIAMDYHMRAAKANFEAYLDVREENPEAANSFKRMVSEHEGTAGILERRMKKNGSQYDGLFLNVTGNLPEGGKALWEKVYEANKEKLGEERAAKIAWGAVKQAGWSQDKDGKWVHKNNSELPTYKKGYLPTAMLIGYTFNKGSRTQAEIETTRTYIQQHGVTKPVWVQCNGSIKILDGNHRVALADELHIEQIPVRVVDSDLNTMDPEAVYRRWLYEQDQGYLE